jgi:hypothetical protein
MKYMLMIYNNPAALAELSEDELESIMDRVDDLMEELQKTGEYVSGMALTESAWTVRVRGGVPSVTDGPFAEAKEQLAGYLLVDCALERAIEIAGLWPDARFGAMEVRPVADDVEDDDDEPAEGEGFDPEE